MYLGAIVCECEFCTYHRYVEDIKGRHDSAEMLQLIDELYERYIMTDFDLDVRKAVEAGTWPSARQQGYGIIKRAEEYETGRTQNRIQETSQETSKTVPV